MSVFGSFSPLGQLTNPPEEYQHPADETTGDILEKPANEQQLTGFVAAIAIVFLFLFAALFKLQVIYGTSNLLLAEGNRIRTKIIPAPRGIIFDRNNQPLVKNVAEYDLEIIPSDLPKKKEDKEAVFSAIIERFGAKAEAVVEKINRERLVSFEPIVLEKNLSLEKALAYQVYFKDLSGISIAKTPIRSYLEGRGLSHVLGYIGKITKDELAQDSDRYYFSDWIGKNGLEKSYEEYIKGVDGQEQSEVDARGRLQRVVSIFSQKQGDNLKLSLDLPLQEASFNALSKSVSENGNGSGAAIAMNPKTGEVYSLVSLPDYDLNIFVQGKEEVARFFSDPGKPLLNRAVSGSYPSGSTIKPVYAAAALQEKIVSPLFAVDTPSEIRIGEFVFPDWKDHGLTDIRRAIAESNNIFFYALGGGWDKIKGLGIKKMEEYLRAFGFGQKTGIDLPAEKEGFVPSPQWKKEKKNQPWYIGDTYHLAIGQGDISVTPIQMLNSVSAIANGGKIIKPHLASQIESSDGRVVKKIDTAVISDKTVSDNNLKVVREGMRQGVESGSSRSIKDLIGLNGKPVNPAGKTGTAQTGKDDKTHAWFVGYAPYDDPQIALVVLVEEGGEGFQAAIPVAAEMFKTFFRQ